MKLQIRQGCFETNSSSSHSLTISSRGNYSYGAIPVFREFYNEKEDKEYKNAVVLTGGEFGWGVDYYQDSLTKANYLAVMLKNYNIGDLEMFESLLKEETGAEQIIYDFTDDWDSSNFSYIDHQSADSYTVEEAYSSKENLKNFIFNRESILIIDNDNH